MSLLQSCLKHKFCIVVTHAGLSKFSGFFVHFPHNSSLAYGNMLPHLKYFSKMKSDAFFFETCVDYLFLMKMGKSWGTHFSNVLSAQEKMHNRSKYMYYFSDILKVDKHVFLWLKKLQQINLKSISDSLQWWIC